MNWENIKGYSPSIKDFYFGYVVHPDCVHFCVLAISLLGYRHIIWNHSVVKKWNRKLALTTMTMVKSTQIKYN